ncbi:hypothetical protein PF006_g15698 [Phytophthora fragariae]|uniref:Protein kinase domain-containing protein n=1 Tax=Phytophthora fragariae TaxID=53985 RepID=A0A6A3T7L5_9STRA|nr:hypothetical protein PF006_g15698 [Phytophthora fragariae]
MEHTDLEPGNVTAPAPQPPPAKGPQERRWAGHCGCDGSCEFQRFDEDMELIDVRTQQMLQDQQQPGEGSPPLLLHLLMMCSNAPTSTQRDRGKKRRRHVSISLICTNSDHTIENRRFRIRGLLRRLVMELEPPTELRVLSRLRSACDARVHVVSRSLVPRLEALYRVLYAPKDESECASDDEWDFLAVLSRRRHQETTFRALVQQLQELVGISEEINETKEEDNTEFLGQKVLQLLLLVPRKSREVHWMHLQIDALMGGEEEEEKEEEKKEWQENWLEDYRDQILFFEEFLNDEEKLKSELGRMEENERLELLTSLQYEGKKLKEAENAEAALMPLEEQKFMEHAVAEVARAGGLEVAAVPRWFVPRYEVRVIGGEEKEVGCEEGEWNGLQVTLEYVQDTPDLETRCTAFVEKWHGVADPHVLRLHGACHVGSTPFLVFESLRDCVSLVEYAKSVPNPRKLWKRLLEVARGLQHLHNVGIVHGGISAACLLIGGDGKAKLKPSVCDRDDRAPSMENDVYEFAVAILEVVHPHVSVGYGDSTGNLSSIEEDREDFGGVNNTISTLVSSMTSSEPRERPDMTYVVRALLNLADRERTWSDMHFPELLLHAPDVWTALRAASQRHESGVILCARVLARLERVLARLWDEGLSFADGENVEYNWQTRTEHLLRSMRYLTRHYLPSVGQRELLKIALTRRFTDEIQQIHYQLDALLAEFDNESLVPELSPNDEVSNRSTEDWELQWEYDCGDLVASYHSYLDDLEENGSVLKTEVAMEAMPLMKHGLDNYRYAFSDVQLRLLLGYLASKEQVRDRSGDYPLHEEAEERTNGVNEALHFDAVSEGKTDVLVPSGTELLTISQVLETLNTQILEPSDGEMNDISNMEASSGSDLNMQILVRLEDFYERLCVAESSAGEESDRTDDSNYLSTIVSDFAEVLTQFRAHVNASRTGNRITQIAAIRQRASDKFSFHKELDDLLDRLHAYHPLESLQIHDWKRQWYEKRARQTESFEWTLIKPEAAELLLDELKDAHDREEMLAFLRFEVTRHRSSYTPAQVEAIGSTCTDISRRLSDATAASSGASHSHLWRPPKWFIPPYEAVSGEFPWGQRLPDAAVRFHVRRGVLPPRPKGFEDDAHWDLIRQMCCFDPQQRLKLPVVVQRLTRFADLEARRQRGGVGLHMRELLFGGSATS